MMMMPVQPPTICTSTRIWVKTVYITILAVTIVVCPFHNVNVHMQSNAFTLHPYVTTSAAPGTVRFALSVDSKDGSDSHVPLFVVFGRPGAGKSTVADAAVAKFREKYSSSDNNKNHSCLGLDLDVCIPQWMKDNFANGIYPTLDERISFAHDACDYVSRQIEEELSVLSKNEGKQEGGETNESIEATTLCCCVSFSFVNTDLRDVFRSRFPHSRWILVDTSDKDAEDRIKQREDHFYKGKNPESGVSDSNDKIIEDETIEPDMANSKNINDEDNSEWEFAPVTFPHTRLDGRDQIDTNAKKVLQEIISTITDS